MTETVTTILSTHTAKTAADFAPAIKAKKLEQLSKLTT